MGQDTFSSVTMALFQHLARAPSRVKDRNSRRPTRFDAIHTLVDLLSVPLSSSIRPIPPAKTPPDVPVPSRELPRKSFHVSWLIPKPFADRPPVRPRKSRNAHTLDDFGGNARRRRKPRRARRAARRVPRAKFLADGAESLGSFRRSRARSRVRVVPPSPASTVHPRDVASGRLVVEAVRGMGGFDPEPEVPPAPPPYPDGERGARYAMTPSEFDARADAWRERALSGRLDAEIRQSRAFREATFARELWRTAAFVLATFPITTGALLALNPALPPSDPDPNPDPVARMLARVGQCDRWGGAPDGGGRQV